MINGSIVQYKKPCMHELIQDKYEPIKQTMIHIYANIIVDAQKK